MVTTTVSVAVDGTPVDACRVALPVTISHGRSGMGAQPDAPTLTLTWADPVVGAFPLGGVLTVTQERAADQVVAYDDPAVLWDDPATLWDAGALGTSVRFTGRISGVTAVERAGPVQQYEVRAVGVQADLGRVHILASRPQESELARVAAIGAAAGIAIHTAGTTQMVLAADVVDLDALAALHRVCESTAGLLWQDRAGRMWFGTADHRETDPQRVLPACAILDGLEWSQSLEQIVNRVTVRYGATGADLQVTHSDTTSVGQWGVHQVDVSSLAAGEADADRLALHIIARRAQPYWLMPGVMVPLDDLPAVDFDVLQDAEVSTGILAPISQQPGTLPAPVTDWVVEGWTETFDESGHWMQLALSDRDRYGATGQREWGVADNYTWAHERDLSWLEALVEVTP